MKYFITSDLHGCDPNLLSDLLNKNKFSLKYDTLVVGGDITDGYGYDNELIEYLMWIEQHGNLIAIKGNHDIRKHDFLKTHTKRWLDDLPYQFENEHFKLAHGMWTDGNIFPYLSDKKLKELSLKGCPVLLGSKREEWLINSNIYNSASLKTLTIENYVKNFAKKPLILGHFWPTAIEFHSKGRKGFKMSENGLYDYDNTIYWADPDVNRFSTITNEWFAMIDKIMIWEK